MKTKRRKKNRRYRETPITEELTVEYYHEVRFMVEEAISDLTGLAREIASTMARSHRLGDEVFSVGYDLTEEYNFYLEHRVGIKQKYKGRTVVIRGREIVGSRKDYFKAHDWAMERYEAGSYLIQKIGDDGSDQSIVVSPLSLD